MQSSAPAPPLANYKRQIGHSRAAAFANFSEADAVKRHPELKSLYRGWRKSVELCNERFAADEPLRDRCLMGVKEEIVSRLQAGESFGVRDVYAAAKEIAMRLSE